MPWLLVNVSGAVSGSPAFWRHATVGSATTTVGGWVHTLGTGDTRVWITVETPNQVRKLLRQALKNAKNGTRVSDNAAFADVTSVVLGLTSAATAAADSDAAAAQVAIVREWLTELACILEGVALVRTAPPAVKCAVLAIGPQLAAAVAAVWLAAHKLGFASVNTAAVLKADTHSDQLVNAADRYLNATPALKTAPDRLNKAAGSAALVVSAGGVVGDDQDTPVLLQHEATGATAAYLAVLGASERLIHFTDDSGLFTTTQPADRSSGVLLRSLTYGEAAHIARAGSAAISAAVFKPARFSRVTIDVRHGMAPLASPDFTRITESGSADAERLVAVSASALLAVTVTPGASVWTLTAFDAWNSASIVPSVVSQLSAFNVTPASMSVSDGAVKLVLTNTAVASVRKLQAKLATLANVHVSGSCSIVSVVGRKFRNMVLAISQLLKPSLDAGSLHLVSESPDGSNCDLVCDDVTAPTLAAAIHEFIVASGAVSGKMCRDMPALDTLDAPTPSSEALTFDRTSLARKLPARIAAGGGAGSSAASDDTKLEEVVLTTGASPAAAGGSSEEVAAAAISWWRQPDTRRRLLDYLAASPWESFYVYDIATVTRQAAALNRLVPIVDQFYFAMKANGAPHILKAIASQGFGLECVSANELKHAHSIAPDAPLLFTPNFCPPVEYDVAYSLGAEVTIDGPDVLHQLPETFRGKAVALRVDPGRGLGHSKKVVTAGASQKFGHPIAEVAEVAAAAKAINCRITGLHVHVGSGVLDPTAWVDVARTLLDLLDERGVDGQRLFPDVKWLDVGGGLGVPEHAGQTAINLSQFNDSLAPLAAKLKAREPSVDLHMEPGRFLVSQAGALLVHVTQVRTKGAFRFVGVSTGMNSLIRPALYEAYHDVFNLSRLEQRRADDPVVQIVGPICETGDVMAKDRQLPAGTAPGDVLIFTNGGAYGAAMSSFYNRRTPAAEVALMPDGTFELAPGSNFPVW